MLIHDPPAQLTDNLWMLASNAYPLYLFKGESEAAIFEGGIGAMGPLLSEQMDQLGLSKEFVKQIVITHAHPDHVMAVPSLRELFPQAAVVASEAAAKTLSVEKAISFFCKIDDALCGALLEAGVITEAHRRKPLHENRIAVDRIVTEGDVVEVDGTVFNVLETPGHSAGGLGFYQPEAGILFPADSTGYYLPEHEYWWPDYFVDYGDYLGCMRRLEGLGAKVLCLGHNCVIEGADEVKSYFSAAMAATERYHQRIVEESRSGKSVREIAEQLGAEVYEMTQLLPLDFFQKNCALLVMQSLKHEGIEG